LDAFVERPVSPWDYAGGAVIAAEAGAILADAWGDPLTLASRGVFAATPAIAADLRALVRRDRIATIAAALPPLIATPV
jgi:myo-inositol-1(or 4)-monophosphatase